MSSTVHVGSASQFRTLLSTSNVVVTDFYADWCGPCKQMAPLFEQLSSKYSKPKSVAFAKVNVDNQQQISQQYGVTAMPTFLIFRSGSVIQTLRGADPRALTSAIENAVKLAAAAKPTYSSTGYTLGGGPSARPSQSVQRPWSWDLKKLFTAIVNFLGLYFISLFSIDPYGSAENSPFNIHREPPKPAVRVVGKAGPKPGMPAPKERKVGTIADITG